MSYADDLGRACPQSVLDHNLTLVQLMGESEFKRFKAAYNLLVSVGILAIAVVAIEEGAEPTTIGGLAIAGLLTVNGVSLAEWLAVKQELQRQGDAGE